MWATFNPASPSHWFKKRVVDNIEDLDGRLIMFHMDDNPTLTPEVRKRYESSFTGHWKKRYIDGEWAGASGLIYPEWKTSYIRADKPGKPTLSMDWGVSSVFAMLMFKKHGTEQHVVSEYRHDTRTDDLRTEDEHIKAIKAWWSSLNDIGMEGIPVYCDPSTPMTFKRKLRKLGLHVRNADNSVVDGIVSTTTRLNVGEILIGDCPELIKELGSYSWDSRRADRGEDAPLKVDDHLCDALRYYSHTTGKVLRKMARNQSVKEALRLVK